VQITAPIKYNIST